MVERPIGRAVVFFVSRSLEDGTWCWEGVLIAVTGRGQLVGVGYFRNYLGMGCSLVGTVGVFTICNDVSSHILIIGTCVLVQHGETVVGYGCWRRRVGLLGKVVSKLTDLN